MGKYTLVGVNGNAYAVMGYVSEALRECGMKDKVSAYKADAMSGDYSHLIRVSLDTLAELNDL